MIKIVIKLWDTVRHRPLTQLSEESASSGSGRGAVLLEVMADGVETLSSGVRWAEDTVSTGLQEDGATSCL